jgi:hypothetical protein
LVATVSLMLILALLDLWGVGSTLYKVRPAQEVFSEGGEAAAWLGSQGGRFRVYSPSYSIPQHTGAVYNVEAADGVDPFQLADYAAFMRAASGVDLSGYSVTIPSFREVAEGEDMLLAHRQAAPDLRLLGLLNVRYVAAAYPMEAEGLEPLGERGGVYLHRNERLLARAFVVGRVEVAQGFEDALNGLAGNDPARAAVVEGERPLAGPARSGPAQIVAWTPNYLEVHAEGPGLLVLSEIYDPDWRVHVDGQAAEVVRADGILRGVYLEQGAHRVAFTYWPSGLWAGTGLTAAGWVSAAVLWIAGRRPCRR